MKQSSFVRIIIQHLMSCMAGATGWCWRWDHIIDPGGSALVAPGAALWKQMFASQSDARGETLNAESWLVCLLLYWSQRPGRAPGQTRPLVPTVWPVIDSLMWNRPQFKSDSTGHTQTTTCCFDKKQFGCVFLCVCVSQFVMTITNKTTSVSDYYFNLK